MKRKYSILCLSIVLISMSCKKLIEVDPPIDTVNGKNVFNSNSTAAAVLTGIYNQMSSGSFTSGINGVSVVTGLYCDELQGTNSSLGTALIPYYSNTLTTDNSPFWSELYKLIHTCNAAIEGLTASTTLSSGVKQQLIGEAKFLRGFFFFYLANYYGDVPLVLSSDYQTNAILSRAPKTDVYNQIITDLKEAETLLSEKYLAADVQSISTDRVRPTRAAAKAMLARVYLFNREWENAEVKATELINSVETYHLETNLNNVFLANSAETIWQLQPVDPNFNTADGNVFILVGEPDGTSPVFLSNEQLNAFENGDNRKIKWIASFKGNARTYYYPNKYKTKSGKDMSEYFMVFRLAEQYLIRAEARNKAGNISGCVEDLNVLRSRARIPSSGNLPDLPANISQENAMNAIVQERRAEMFTEWGTRWLDLKRTEAADVVMNALAPLKGGTWAPFKKLFPIPLYDIRTNKNLVQNPGYN